MTPQKLVFWARLKNQYMNGENVQKVFCLRTVMLQFLMS